MFVDVKNNMLFNLSTKDCMYVTSTLKDAPLQNLTIIGRSHGLKEAWVLVLVGHSCHSPSLALHSYLSPNPNGFLYPLSNPPTHPSYALHQQFPLLLIVHILQNIFLHFQDSKLKWDLNLLYLSFSISHCHDESNNGKINISIYKQNLGILQLLHMIWGFVSLYTWEHHIIVCLTLSTILLKSGK